MEMTRDCPLPSKSRNAAIRSASRRHIATTSFGLGSIARNASLYGCGMSANVPFRMERQYASGIPSRR